MEAAMGKAMSYVLVMVLGVILGVAVMASTVYCRTEDSCVPRYSGTLNVWYAEGVAP